MSTVKGNLKDLKKGQTLLVSVRRVNSSDPNVPKVQLEFAELIENTSRSSNPAQKALLKFNSKDSRFAGSKPRRAWMTADLKVVEEMFDLDLSTLASVGNSMDLNILNPEVEGERLRVRIEESVQPTEYQAENPEDTAKRAGAEGNFITHNGKLVFSNSEVLITNEEVEHVFLESDAPATADASISLTSLSTAEANELLADV